jgi:hypothetical protein
LAFIALVKNYVSILCKFDEPISGALILWL